MRKISLIVAMLIASESFADDKILTISATMPDNGNAIPNESYTLSFEAVDLGEDRSLGYSQNPTNIAMPFLTISEGETLEFQIQLTDLTPELGDELFLVANLTNLSIDGSSSSPYIYSLATPFDSSLESGELNFNYSSDFTNLKTVDINSISNSSIFANLTLPKLETIKASFTTPKSIQSNWFLDILFTKASVSRFNYAAVHTAPEYYGAITDLTLLEFDAILPIEGDTEYNINATYILNQKSEVFYYDGVRDNWLSGDWFSDRTPIDITTLESSSLKTFDPFNRDTTFAISENIKESVDENGTKVLKSEKIDLGDNRESELNSKIYQNGESISEIKIFDKTTNEEIVTRVKAPKGVDISIDESGNSEQVLDSNSSISKVKTKISGEIEGSLELKLDDNLTTEMPKRAFIAPAGADTTIDESGTTQTINEAQSVDGSKIKTQIDIESNGRISALATKEANSSQRAIGYSEVLASYVAPSYSTRGKIFDATIKVLFEDYQNRAIGGGKFEITYSAREEFSFAGEFIESDSATISNSITPTTDIAKFEEIQTFDGSRSLTLTEGSADIELNGELQSMNLNQTYDIPTVENRALELSKGWNLVSLPLNGKIDSSISSISSGAYNFSIFDNYSVIWVYRDGVWSLNPDEILASEGFWIKSETIDTINFGGFSYQNSLESIGSDWKLIGVGEDIENLSENYNIYRYTESEGWSNKRDNIEAGEALWIKR